MKLEQQVCSLQLAKRLTELGVKHESFLIWRKSQHGNGWLVEGYKTADQSEHYAAFTVAELGSLLPNGTISWFDPYNDWQCKTSNSKKHIKRQWSEADTRARMLIYLIENKLIAA
jgi:hypothetical protein